MNLEDAAIKSTMDTVSQFGMNVSYIETLEKSVLSSGGQVNVIIGFTEGLKGNAMLVMTRATALCIASVMMGGMQFNELDELSISAVAELGNIIVGNTFNNFDSDTMVNFTPPTIVTGDSVTLMMGNIKTKKFSFDIDGNPVFFLLGVESCIQNS